MKKMLLLIVVLVFSVFVPIKAEASIYIDWLILNNDLVYGPEDIVELKARLVNLSNSTENLTDISMIQFGSSLFPTVVLDNPPPSNISLPPGAICVCTVIVSINSEYKLRFGPEDSNNIYAQFMNLNIAPGEAIDFIHTRFIPNEKPAPAGRYSVNQIVGLEGDYYNENRSQEFRWRVQSVNSTQNAAVPEPASILLLASGLTGIFIRQRKISKIKNN